MTEERPTDPTPVTEDTTVTPPPEAPAYTPSYTPPPIAPPVAPQPAVAWAPPPAAGNATGKRTTLSLAAGILLTVLGILGGLMALAILTIGREVVSSFDFTNMPGIDTRGADVGAIAGSAVTFVGILLLVFSAFYIIGGVGVMRSANWGRVMGIVIGILAGLFWLAGVTGGSQGQGNGIGFALVLLAIHAYVAIALLFYWRNKAPA
jgi:hypothetical protein